MHGIAYRLMRLVDRSIVLHEFGTHPAPRRLLYGDWASGRTPTGAASDGGKTGLAERYWD